jgi:DNA-binding SARP family transcriptional activator
MKMNPHIPIKADRERAMAVETVTAEVGKGAQYGFPVVPALHLLGDFRLIWGETPVMNIDLPRLQSLVAYLVLHQSVPQSRSQLAFLLWPDTTDAQAHTNLRNLLFKLRKALPSVSMMLHMDRNMLQWRSDMPWKLDVLDFERAVARADRAEQEGDRINLQLALEQAAQIYQGDLFPKCFDEWILPERDRLCQLFLNVLERLLRLLEREGDYAGAIRTAQRLLRHDPLHEATYSHLMRLYAASGNRAAVVRTYQSCVAVLERELGVGASAATQQAYEQFIQVGEVRRETTFPKIYPREEAQKRQKNVSPLRRVERRKWAVKAGHICVIRRTDQKGCGAIVSR